MWRKAYFDLKNYKLLPKNSDQVVLCLDGVRYHVVVGEHDTLRKSGGPAGKRKQCNVGTGIKIDVLRKSRSVVRHQNRQWQAARHFADNDHFLKLHFIN